MNRFNLISAFVLIFASLSVFSCGGGKQAAGDDTSAKVPDSVYVFDSPQVRDTVIEQPKVEPPKMEAKYYVVQIGAFTTKDKAEKFEQEARLLLKNKIEISYSNNINLYVVQLTPPYNKKEEAEKVRDNLWKIDKFKDAWILTVTR